MNPPIRGLTVCVEYDDLLSKTLPLNLHHFEEVLVITAPQDKRTQDLVKSLDKCRLLVTDAFYRYNAKFNKGWAIELGFEELGREGWILVHDADMVFPKEMDLSEIQIGHLYNPRRQMMDRPAGMAITNDPNDWSGCPLTHDWEFPGYFQLFHADDPHLSDRPWYDPGWTHAGRCDSVFQNKWPQEKKIRLPFNVLHLGPRDTNWFGRVSDRLDGESIPNVEEKASDFDEFWRAMGWKAGPRPENYSDRLTP